MSFSDLVSGGAACGPSNPLQSLGKRFGQDRSSQMDRFDGGGESSSGASFRTHQGTPSGNVAAAADPSFFHQQGAAPGRSFDLQPLKGALPHLQAPQGANGRHASPVPPSAEMHNAWQQHQHAAAFERNFYRHDTPPMVNAASDPQWAREFPSTAQQHRSSPQTHTTHPQQQYTHGPMAYGQGAMPYQAHSRMGMMGMHPGGGVHAYGSSQFAPTVEQRGEGASKQQTNAAQWDTAFTEMEQRSKSSSPLHNQSTQDPAVVSNTQVEEQQRHIDPHDADELAKTAGRLVSTVEHETNDKFKQSNFLNLMRKIRDRQAGIQGTDIVESSSDNVLQDQAQPMTTHGYPVETVDVKGKGKASQTHGESTVNAASRPLNQLEETSQRAGGVDPLHAVRTLPAYLSKEEIEGRQMMNEMWAEEDARSEAIEREAMNRIAFVGDGGDSDLLRAEDEAEFNKYQNLLGAHLGPAAAGLRQKAATASSMEEVMDELEGADFVGRKWEGTQGRGVPGAQTGEWGQLQEEWDAWQANSAGIEQSREVPQSAASAPQYRFHAYNPYVGAVNNPAREATAASLPADMQSVLEREAAVQRDPTNASAWLELGVKQQENEREGLAIAALHRAIQLDPTIREAWLALAVSYTNESDRSAALEAVERWVDATPEYRGIAHQFRQRSSTSKASQLATERHEDLTNLLIALARHTSAEGKIDADVQVALGVLFNASEDYDKAVDCFTTALQVRPDDWLMYNRLGATLSNSGRSAEALRYYQQALDLKPGFVRCHFNMSISCLNLQMYREAASHIYTALSLQSESVDLSQDALMREQAASGDSLSGNGGGVTSSSLWETLRVACELMDRPDLANLAVQRDLDRFDPSEFWSSGEETMQTTV